MLAQKIDRLVNAPIPGIGPDAPIETMENGAKQSMLDYRFDLLPPMAMFRIASILHQGSEKYGDRNWLGIGIDSHLNHVLMHLFAHMHEDESDKHLEHMACRAIMALERHLLDTGETNYSNKRNP